MQSGQGSPQHPEWDGPGVKYSILVIQESIHSSSSIPMTHIISRKGIGLLLLARELLTSIGGIIFRLEI